MQDKQNIAYRPSLEITKRYDTDGKIKSPIPALLLQPPTKAEQIQQIEETIDRLYETIVFLPEAIKRPAKVILNTLELIYVSIDQEYIFNPSEEDPDFEIEEDTDFDKVDEDGNVTDSEKDNDIQLSKVQPSYIINIKEDDKIKVIQQKFYDALLQITEHYIDQYEASTTSYFIELGKLLNRMGTDDLSFVNNLYTINVNKIKNPDLKHVSDFIVRSQVARDQHYRMFNKVCNDRESLNLMKACEASKELLVRYEKEKYIENTDEKQRFKNLLLYESRASYEKRIEQNLYSLYKYLNSSVILLGECLNMYAKEAEAKLILMKEEGLTL